MEDKAPKTFLDSLLDPTSRLFSFSSLTRGLTRAAGIRRNFDSFGDGQTLNGTDRNDTIVIKNDLTGGSPKDPDDSQQNATHIDFMGGNDSLKVGGKITAKNDQHISLEGDSNSVAITAGGLEGKDLTIEGNNDTAIYIKFFDGDGAKTIHVTNDIVSNAILGANDHNDDAADFLIIKMDGIDKRVANALTVDGNFIADRTESEVTISGIKNQLTIGKDLTVTNYGTVDFELAGGNDTYKIGGNVTASHHADIGFYISDESFSGKPSIGSFTSGNITASDNSYVDIYITADKSLLSVGNLYADNGSSISMHAGPWNYELTNNTIINGNIETVNNGRISFDSLSMTTLEVKGVISSKSYEDFDTSHPEIEIKTDDRNDTLKFDGGFSLVGGNADVKSGAGNDNIIVGRDISLQDNGKNGVSSLSFQLEDGDDKFTLNGNISNTGGNLKINAGSGNDTILIKGNVSAALNGNNVIDCGEGNDTVTLNGHIDAGALTIDGGDGHDMLVLTAANNNAFISNYKDWLSDLSSSGSLATSNIETIRLDVRGLQTSNLGWLTDIINKANSDGAHIAVTDRTGHQLVNPSAYLAQGNDTHNPINDVLDHYAPAAANATQPKAFADHIASPSTDAFSAPHFDNNNFLHELEQQAQVHAAAVA